MVDIRKNAAETIRIQPTKFRDYHLVDVRVWIDGDRPGDVKPTRKGIAFRREQLPEVIAALQDIAASEAGEEAESV